MGALFDEDEGWWAMGGHIFLMLGCGGIACALLLLPLSLFTTGDTVSTFATVVGIALGGSVGHDLFRRVTGRRARVPGPLPRHALADTDTDDGADDGGARRPRRAIGRTYDAGIMRFEEGEGWWTVGAHMFFALACGAAAFPLVELPLHRLFGGTPVPETVLFGCGMLVGDRTFQAMRYRRLRKRRAACDPARPGPDTPAHRSDA